MCKLQTHMISLLNTYTDKQFAELVSKSDSISDVAKKLGYHGKSGAMWITIKKRIETLEINTSHFTYGVKCKQRRTKQEIFKKDSKVDQSTLRRRYFSEGITPYVCSICGQKPIWQNQKMTLILDHINGVNNDNRIENLRWVCPNCNSQLPTTGGRNTKRLKRKHFCINCGNEIYPESIRCNKCEKENRKKHSKILNTISRKTLKKLIREKPFKQIAKQYNVSDNAIKKWCDFYNLPRLKSEIKKYSDKEWKKL